MARAEKNGTTWDYTYNADGLRTSKSNGTETWNYVYNGSLLTQMTKGDDTLYFTYDTDGTPLTVTHNGTKYNYITNIQGDVVALVVLAAAAPSASCALIMGKEAHYTRNDCNTVKIETIDQVPSDWTTSNTDKYPDRGIGAAANAHQNTAPSKDKPNTKFSSPNKREEVIFSYDEILIVDPVDVGTYNYGTNIVTHWYYDVVPWMWWGNTEDDPTTVWDRANVFVWGAS